MLGDINIDLLDEVESSDYLNRCMANGFLSIQNQATREGSCLDHVFSNMQSSMVSCYILDNQITDHAIVSINLELENTHQNEDETVTVRKTNEELFKKYLKNADWKWVREIGNTNISINKHFERLISTMQDCHEKATKTKVYKLSRKLKKRQPWITAEVLILVNKKAKAYQRYRVDRGNMELKKNFQLLSARVKKETDILKKNYYTKMLDENWREPRKYWDIINEVRGKRVKNEIEEIEISNEMVAAKDRPSKVAEEFNKFFNEIPDRLIKEAKFDDIVENMGQNVATKETLEEGDDGDRVYSPKLDCFQLTCSDVERAIIALKIKWSSTNEGLSSRLAKDIAKFLAAILTPLFNKSLRDGAFPDVLKFAILVPVFKGGTQTQINN